DGDAAQEREAEEVKRPLFSLEAGVLRPESLEVTRRRLHRRQIDEGGRRTGHPPDDDQPTEGHHDARVAAPEPGSEPTTRAESGDAGHCRTGVCRALASHGVLLWDERSRHSWAAPSAASRAPWMSLSASWMVRASSSRAPTASSSRDSSTVMLYSAERTQGSGTAAPVGVVDVSLGVGVAVAVGASMTSSAAPTVAS